MVSQEKLDEISAKLKGYADEMLKLLDEFPGNHALDVFVGKYSCGTSQNVYITELTEKGADDFNCDFISKFANHNGKGWRDENENAGGGKHET